MTDMDSMIRAARGRTIDGSTSNADMDAAIRAAAGYGPPPAAQQQEGNDQASAEQLQAARLAGLPDRFAHRVTGADLAADARSLRSVLEAAGAELPASPTFDGGSRGTHLGPEPVKDMNALIRGHRMVQKQRVYEEARIEQQIASGGLGNA